MEAHLDVHLSRARVERLLMLISVYVVNALEDANQVRCGSLPVYTCIQSCFFDIFRSYAHFTSPP